MATLTELIRQEDPKRPYTDEQLAQMLQLRREQVVELRRINGIPNSWMRLRPALVVEMQKLLEQEPGLSDRSLTLRLNAMGYNVSRYLVKELHSNLPEKKPSRSLNRPWKSPRKRRPKAPTCLPG